MPSGPSRRNASPDPVRQNLVEVRRGLLRLHKALIDSERAIFERQRGALTNVQLLQALLEDPFFAWLRPFSGLLVEIDEALASREPMSRQSAEDFLDRVRALVAPGDQEAAGAAPERYQEAVRRDSDVLLLHIELTSRLRAQ